ncbi:carbohydrate ABC transporter permease [Paenibacillus xerothermodurans]|uniref:Carbohydrate ABC transporter permease n=1 Tax=Paenibacillus xerothermodurans TaxID=1977292 RepID=A0A2W1NBW6_PAEXE|nr:carbohydrate ABC transporter permease [Paenibacillus xerothermodurans]PZE21140.1 carbohydrate ABC transporter permease [Paenibacillus xerothermodurans]
MYQNQLIKETGGDKLFTVLICVASSVILVAVLYPLVYVVSASFSSPTALMSGRVWLFPVEPGLEGYKAVFEYKDVWTGYANTIFYTVAGTIINVVLTIAAAYPLSRKDFYGKKLILLLFTFTMIFSGGMIPTYLLVKELGILNTPWAMLLPNAMSVFNVMVAMSFFRSNIPDELLESAKLDGCSNFRFLVSVVLPLSGAIIAVITLFYAVEHWNSFFDALLYLSDKSLFPLQIFLREILLLNSSDSLTMNIDDQNQRIYLNELLKYSLIVFSSAPLILIYPFVQKHFVKGVMIGSIKG